MGLHQFMRHFLEEIAFALRKSGFKLKSEIYVLNITDGHLKIAWMRFNRIVDCPTQIICISDFYWFVTV